MHYAAQQLSATRRSQVTPQRRRPVVLLRSPRQGHGIASERARQLAEALRTDVLDVHLLAGPGASVERAHAARSRLARRPAAGGAPPLLTLPAGDTSQLARTLRALEAQVVVLASTRTWPGDCVVHLAEESGITCVVARRPRPAQGVIAASSLLDPKLPVIHAAANWASALHQPLTLLHHVEPHIARADAPSLEAQAERLARAHDASVTLTHGSDPVADILHVARASDADVIVVGVPATHGSASRCVAPRVAAMAWRSVMVVPRAA
jgi:nucleotide-binding universal stress UspA family protein